MTLRNCVHLYLPLVGGIYVEVLKDSSLRVLPIGRAEVQAMLDELHGKALLQGARGSKPANMDAPLLHA
jgi:acetate---CoA ligase (ADP-forming)